MRRTTTIVLLALCFFPVAGLTASATPPAVESVVPAMVRVDSDAGITHLPAHMPVPAASNGVGPGSPLLISHPDGTFGCTANFVWTTATATYLGAAGHCFLPADKASTHGADADYDPALTEVSVCITDCRFGGQTGFIVGGFVDLGPVAYARQSRAGVAFTHDFGIVEIPSTLSDQIRPQVPVWEGPSSIEDVTPGGGVCLYGNAGGFGEVFATKARTGVGQGLDDSGRGWLAIIPSFQGDSGGALVTCGPDADGMHGLGAAGLVTHIGLLQDTARMIGTTVAGAAEMTLADAGIDLQLVLEDGSEVDPPVLPPRTDAPQPITPDETTPVTVGGSHSWTAGPFTRSAPPETALIGDECSGVEPATEHCDYEFVTLDVPADGATFTTTIGSDDPAADFDLFVFDPDGQLVGSSAQGAGLEEVVTAQITRAGTYTLGVDPYDAADASYSGTVELGPAEPPPPAVFDGEVSPGTSYSWTGTVPIPTSPVFTCADLVQDTCDNELIKVNVPDGGGTLVVDITADVAEDDFDVCLYTPSNVQTCFNEVGDEHVELPVTAAGVYRVGVKAYVAPNGTYQGVAALS